MVVAKTKDNLGTVGSDSHSIFDIWALFWGGGGYQGFSEPQFPIHKMGIVRSNLGSLSDSILSSTLPLTCYKTLGKFFI